jgi:hypothetical protein
MIKRNLGEALSGVSRHARNRQMCLLAVMHNILMVLFIEGFATEHTYPLFGSCLLFCVNGLRWRHIVNIPLSQRRTALP